ncbi:MAG: transporter substrate-binding domain-containing protein [Kiritimatiellae bacterium]|nr:transporter substrate-binding domain-containing protein [Kiritimatiellia bacterium]
MKHSVCMFAVAVAASTLFFGCSGEKADKDILSSAKDAVSGAATAVKDTAVAAADKTAEVAGAAVDKASDAAVAVKDAAVAAADKTAEVAGAAVDKAAEVATAAKDKAVEAVEAVKDAAVTAGEKTAEVAGAAADKAAEVAGAAKDATVAAGEKTAEVAGAAVAAVAGAVGISTAKEGTIRMITEAIFPPYEFRQGKEVVGIDVEICKAIAKALGKELAIEDVEFDSVIPSLIAGKAELAAAGITVNEERKMQVDFSVPYVRTGIVLIFAKDKAIETKEAAKGKKIGVQNGTTSADFVRKDLGQEPDMFDSPASAFAALKAGKVDAVIADIDPAKAVIKGQDGYDISDLLTVEEYAVAIKKGQPELLATVNKVIQGLLDSGELDKITDDMTAKADAMAAAEEAKPAEAPKAE